MGLDNFTPTVWAKSLLSPLYKALVYGSLVNRDYEGEISSLGDSVKINEIGDITVSDFSKFTTTGSTSTALSWQALTSAQKMLYIDKAKSFSFAIDNVDMAAKAVKEGAFDFVIKPPGLERLSNMLKMVTLLRGLAPARDGEQQP